MSDARSQAPEPYERLIELLDMDREVAVAMVETVLSDEGRPLLYEMLDEGPWLTEVGKQSIDRAQVARLKERGVIPNAGQMDATDAPVWMTSDEANAWVSGWEAAIRSIRLPGGES